MKTFLLFLAMTCTPVALVLAWAWADEWLADLADRRRRAEQDRQTDAEWLAGLAATDTPVFAELAAEQMRAELEAPDAVDRIAGGR